MKTTISEDAKLPVTSEDVLAELRALCRVPRLPVPEESLELLYRVACSDTGSSQAIRSFLFWLVGLPDPTGFKGSGILELRRVDSEIKRAALEVATWFAGATESDDPLYEVQRKLRDRFQAEKDDNF
jgi:hypothetical protein